jgi:hypothetical protein
MWACEPIAFYKRNLWKISWHKSFLKQITFQYKNNFKLKALVFDLRCGTFYCLLIAQTGTRIKPTAGGAKVENWCQLNF